MASTSAERQKARRERIAKAGGIEKMFALDAESLKILNNFRSDQCITYDDAINKIIKNFGERNNDTQNH